MWSPFSSKWSSPRVVVVTSCWSSSESSWLEDAIKVHRLHQKYENKSLNLPSLPSSALWWKSLSSWQLLSQSDSGSTHSSHYFSADSNAAPPLQNRKSSITRICHVVIIVIMPHRKQILNLFFTLDATWSIITWIFFFILRILNTMSKYMSPGSPRLTSNTRRLPSLSSRRSVLVSGR